MNRAIYRLVNRSSNLVIEFRDPSKLACYMLGRTIKEYLIIKTDGTGDRLVSPMVSDITELERVLKNS